MKDRMRGRGFESERITLSKKSNEKLNETRAKTLDDIKQLVDSDPAAMIILAIPDNGKQAVSMARYGGEHLIPLTMMLFETLKAMGKASAQAEKIREDDDDTN